MARVEMKKNQADSWSFEEAYCDDIDRETCDHMHETPDPALTIPLGIIVAMAVLTILLQVARLIR